MGMYTEIVVSIRVPSDSPAAPMLRFLFAEEAFPPEVPDHDFFRAPRWSAIGSSCSFYHFPAVVGKVYEDHGDLRIFNRSDLKNYDREIELFWDWVMPYVDENDGAFLGYYIYEENDIPTIVYKGAF